MCRRLLYSIGSLTLIGLLSGAIPARAQSLPTAIEIPPDATALEGLPQVSIETTRDGATRRELDAAEAAHSRLSINIIDGRFYWAGPDGQPLTMRTSGDFIYLSSNEPGRYVRFRRFHDRLIYVEHVDMPLGSVTYWGELRIVLGR